MDLQRHIAAIIRRNPNQADYCAERIVKLVEKNFTSTNKQSTQLCDDCATNKVAVSVCEPCLLKMIHRGA
jgi:hypothetical protein